LGPTFAYTYNLSFHLIYYIHVLKYMLYLKSFWCFIYSCSYRYFEVCVFILLEIGKNHCYVWMLEENEKIIFRQPSLSYASLSYLWEVLQINIE
jgi:hypothetical protein